jgi:hypothetical protein
MKVTLVNGVLLAGLGLLAMPACATRYPGTFHHGGAYSEYERGQDRAYERGYHHGVKAGAQDWRHHRRFDPWRHGRYRSADSGYSTRYGPLPSYSRAYRAGFRNGYERGYGGGRYSRPGYAVPRG